MDDLSWKTPLLTSGGTVDGPVRFRTNGVLGGGIWASTESVLYVTGLSSDNATSGAGYAQFYGGDHASQPGTVELVARDENSSPVYSLKVTRGGCLANGKHIVRSINSINADASGNISLSLPYLPLTGGTFSGTITANTNTLVRGIDTNRALHLLSSTNTENGALQRAFSSSCQQ